MPKKKKYDYLELVNEDSYCRNFNLELYESWNTDDLKKLQKDNECDYEYKTCDQIIEFIEQNYTQYGYIKHDKDIWTFKDFEKKEKYMLDHDYKVGDLKKPHYHVTIKFKNPRYKSTVAKELGMPFDKIVHCISVDSSIKYDLHIDEDDKQPYDISEFKGPLKLRLLKLVNSYVQEEEKSNMVIDLILSRSWKLPELMREINRQGLYSHFIRGWGIYKTMLEESNLGTYIDVKGSYNYSNFFDDDCISLFNDGKIDLSKIS